jgi:hypothetical protein
MNPQLGMSGLSQQRLIIAGLIFASSPTAILTILRWCSPLVSGLWAIEALPSQN